MRVVVASTLSCVWLTLHRKHVTEERAFNIQLDDVACLHHGKVSTGCGLRGGVKYNRSKPVPLIRPSLIRTMSWMPLLRILVGDPCCQLQACRDNLSSQRFQNQHTGFINVQIFYRQYVFVVFNSFRRQLFCLYASSDLDWPLKVSAQRHSRREIAFQHYNAWSFIEWFLKCSNHIGIVTLGILNIFFHGFPVAVMQFEFSLCSISFITAGKPPA